jgi:hypothetical protein
VGGYSELERLEETEQLSRALGLPNDEPEEENSARNPGTVAPGGPVAPGEKKKKARSDVRGVRNAYAFTQVRDE